MKGLLFTQACPQLTVVCYLCVLNTTHILMGLVFKHKQQLIHRLPINMKVLIIETNTN